MTKFILIGGSIDVGKTTLAYALQNAFPDIMIIENDTIRRELLGFPLDYFMNHDLDNSFSDENNQLVKTDINKRILNALNAGKSVIQCVTFNDVSTYEEYAYVYSKQADVRGLYLKAAETTIRARLQKRKYERKTRDLLLIEHGNASDADEAVLLKYPVKNIEPKNWVILNAEQLPEILLEQAKVAAGFI